MAVQGPGRMEDSVLNRALFISFEGIDGCGKSTHLELLKPYLAELGLDPLYPREPGGTRIGEGIRQILLDKSHTQMSDRTELLLFLAARAQICEEVIAPALADGRMVICDRFMDSSVAYQGAGRGLGAERVKTLNRFAVAETMPDLTLFLDVPVEVARQRLQKRGEASDRIDLESTTFMERTRQGFLSLAAEEPDRFVIVDSTREKTVVQNEIREIIGRYIQ